MSSLEGYVTTEDQIGSDSLPRRAKLIIGTVTAGGLIGLVVTELHADRLAHLSGREWALFGVFTVLLRLSWMRPLVLFRGGESESFHLDEAFFVIMALLLPPAATMTAFTISTINEQLVKRRPLTKVAFNTGEALLGVALGLAFSRGLAVPGHSLSLAAVMAVVGGAVVYFLVSHGSVAALLVSLGVPAQEVILPDASLQFGLAAVGVLVGTVISIAIQSSLWPLALVVPLLVAVRVIIAAQFKSVHDRARMQALFDVTVQANSHLREQAVMQAILESARQQLRCSDAKLVEYEPDPDGLSVALDIGGHRKWLVVSGRKPGEPFEPADRVLLDAIGAIAKSALTNAELYRQVRFERTRLASVTLNIGEGVCAVDAEGNLTFVNPAAAGMVSFPSLRVPVGESAPREAMRAPDFILQPGRAVMAAGGVIREEDAEFLNRNGEVIPVAYTASAVKQGNEVVGAVISFRDITERKKLEASMTRQALYDSLTGLANRRMLVERLEAALERSRTGHQVHAVVFIDLDRFKAINDSLGHGTGDDLLVAVGARLQRVLRAEDLVARFGGDEFVVLLEDISGLEEAVNTARRICAAVEEPLVLTDGYEIVASVSVGIALTEPGQNADDILRDADVAMYKAKGRGGTYQIFDRSLMGIRSSERIDLEAALRKALDRDELQVHFQPLVSIDDLHIVGAEALVRWMHPTEGLIGPDRFVPMAEETGLILPLGRQVLEQACAHVRAVRDRLGLDLPVSVNLSPRQFQQSSLLGDVATVLDDAGLPSHLLTFEITETMVMDDISGASEIMKKLNRLGVRLAIDDFGTGHSSLAYLKQFPIHEVKVDRTFVRGLGADPVDSAIVRAVVDLAEAMKIIAVAEGVETKDQLAGLRMLGCQVGQGYYFSKPLAPDRFDALLDERFLSPEDAAAKVKTSLRIV